MLQAFVAKLIGDKMQEVQQVGAVLLWLSIVTGAAHTASTGTATSANYTTQPTMLPHPANHPAVQLTMHHPPHDPPHHLSHHSPHHPPMQISKLNKHAEGVTWPNVTTHIWKSDDGLPVEGLLLYAAASKSTAPAPLIVFTHCGPAMASLGNNS